MRLVLKFFIAVLNAALEELVRKSLSASPFMKPFLTPGVCMSAHTAPLVS